MFRRILVPCDGTERTAPALAMAVELASQGGGTVVGLHADPALAMDPLPPAVDDPLHAEHFQAVALAQDAAAYMRRRAAERGVACESVTTDSGNDAAAIVDAARTLGCDLIVMGADHAGGIRSRLLGGVTERVMQGCGVPLLVVPAQVEHTA